jgi:hypothetical protein
MNVALNRDQRRLAVAKLASLGDGDPLRQKYQEWISSLDCKLAGLHDAPDEGRIVSERHLPANFTRTREDAVAVENSGGNFSKAAQSYRDALISENRLLREMLERFR